MKKVLVMIALAFSATSVSADTKEKCTTEPKEKWQDQKDFQDKLKADGYKINVFKVTKGDCYEIYGWDKSGKQVEVYFNPVTGSVVTEKKK